MLRTYHNTLTLMWHSVFRSRAGLASCLFTLWHAQRVLSSSHFF